MSEKRVVVSLTVAQALAASYALDWVDTDVQDSPYRTARVEIESAIAVYTAVTRDAPHDGAGYVERGE